MQVFCVYVQKLQENGTHHSNEQFYVRADNFSAAEEKVLMHLGADLKYAGYVVESISMEGRFID